MWNSVPVVTEAWTLRQVDRVPGPPTRCEKGTFTFDPICAPGIPPTLPLVFWVTLTAKVPVPLIPLAPHFDEHLHPDHPAVERGGEAGRESRAEVAGKGMK